MSVKWVSLHYRYSNWVVPSVVDNGQEQEPCRHQHGRCEEMRVIVNYELYVVNQCNNEYTFGVKIFEWGTRSKCKYEFAQQDTRDQIM